MNNDRRSFLKTVCLSAVSIPFVSVLGNENGFNTNYEELYFGPIEKRVKELIAYNRTSKDYIENLVSSRMRSKNEHDAFLKNDPKGIVYLYNERLLSIHLNNNIKRLSSKNERPIVLVSNKDKMELLPYLKNDFSKHYTYDNEVSTYYYVIRENDICVQIFFLESVPEGTIYCLPSNYIFPKTNDYEFKSFNEMEFGTCNVFILDKGILIKN